MMTGRLLQVPLLILREGAKVIYKNKIGKIIGDPCNGPLLLDLYKNAELITIEKSEIPLLSQIVIEYTEGVRHQYMKIRKRLPVIMAQWDTILNNELHEMGLAVNFTVVYDVPGSLTTYMAAYIQIPAVLFTKKEVLKLFKQLLPEYKRSNENTDVFGKESVEPLLDKIIEDKSKLPEYFNKASFPPNLQKEFAE